MFSFVLSKINFYLIFNSILYMDTRTHHRYMSLLKVLMTSMMTLTVRTFVRAVPSVFSSHLDFKMDYSPFSEMTILSTVLRMILLCLRSSSPPRDHKSNVGLCRGSCCVKLKCTTLSQENFQLIYFFNSPYKIVSGGRTTLALIESFHCIFKATISCKNFQYYSIPYLFL